MAASNTKFEFPLLDLPAELVVCIIEKLAGNNLDLRHLAQTCSSLCKIAESLLYQHIFLRDGATAARIVRSLHSRPSRAAAIRSLVVPCKSRVPHAFGPSGIAGILSLAPLLEKVYFESPECATNRFEPRGPWMFMTDRMFQPFAAASHVDANPTTSPLQRLKDLTIHMNGPSSPYWKIDRRTATIFELPSLESLKISCVIIEDDSFSTIKGTRYSPLKNLELEECNITLKGLHDLLSIPSALESCALLEDSHNADNFQMQRSISWNRLFNNNPRFVMKCIDQQQMSLKSFTYGTDMRDPDWGRAAAMLPLYDPTPVDGAFAGYPELESISLKVRGHCPLFERAVLSSRPPPNLRQLSFQGDLPKLSSSEDQPSDLMGKLPFFRAPSAAVPPNLRSLRVTLTRMLLHPSQLKSVTPEGWLGRIMERVAQNLLEIGGVVLEVVALEGNGFFPPYLFGEPVPKEMSIFRNGAYQEEYGELWHRFVDQAQSLDATSSEDETDSDWSTEADDDEDEDDDEHDADADLNADSD